MHRIGFPTVDPIGDEHRITLVNSDDELEMPFEELSE